MSIEVFEPGVEYYAERMKSKPFAFVRYGEGELQVVTPTIPLRAATKRRWDGWSKPGPQRVLRRTLVECHVDESYLVGIWHLAHFAAKHQAPKLERWLKTLPVQTWHDGGVFKEALESGEFGCVIEAMRKQPVVLVGPARLAALPAKVGFEDCRHIVVHHNRAFLDWRRTARMVEKTGPAFFSFSAGGPAKIMIHHLWPRMRDSYLIDFGAVWDVFVGQASRHYHRRLTPRQIARNL